MPGVIVSSPHSARTNRTDRLMLQVILALVPGTLAMVWYFGWGVLINMALATQLRRSRPRPW